MEVVKLLEGVEILSTEPALSLVECGILGFLSIIVVVLSAGLLAKSITESWLGPTILSIFFFLTGLFLCGCITFKAANPTPVYKVTIDNSVSMNEFYNRYEILDVDGKIYIIREKGE